MAAGWEICIFDIGRSAYVHMHDCMHAYMYALRSMQLGKFVYIRDSTHDFHLQVCPRQTPTVCSDHASNSQSPGSAFSRGSVARAAGSERLGSGQPAASRQQAAGSRQQRPEGAGHAAKRTLTHLRARQRMRRRAIPYGRVGSSSDWPRHCQVLMASVTTSVGPLDTRGKSRAGLQQSKHKDARTRAEERQIVR